MSLQGHYQNAYVTHDLDRATARIAERHGASGFHAFDAQMILRTPAGEEPAHMRVALGWVGALQIELIQPVSGAVDAYAAYLPADGSDPSLRLHHIAVRRDDLEAMRQEIRSSSLPLVFESEAAGLVCALLDARESLGHYLEYVWATPEGWNLVGWPQP
jgi:hypothetical protein